MLPARRSSSKSGSLRKCSRNSERDCNSRTPSSKEIQVGSPLTLRSIPAEGAGPLRSRGHALYGVDREEVGALAGVVLELVAVEFIREDFREVDDGIVVDVGGGAQIEPCLVFAVLSELSPVVVGPCSRNMSNRG